MIFTILVQKLKYFSILKNVLTLDHFLHFKTFLDIFVNLNFIWVIFSAKIQFQCYKLNDEINTACLWKAVGWCRRKMIKGIKIHSNATAAGSRLRRWDWRWKKEWKIRWLVFPKLHNRSSRNRKIKPQLQHSFLTEIQVGLGNSISKELKTKKEEIFFLEFVGTFNNPRLCYPLKNRMAGHSWPPKYL